LGPGAFSAGALVLDAGSDCLYITFQETPDEILQRARDFGHELDTAYADGHVQIHAVPIEEPDLDALAVRVVTALESGAIRQPEGPRLRHIDDPDIVP
jgi:KaiC/GvpD/RAD55 family RecA-like ATPase